MAYTQELFYENRLLVLAPVSGAAAERGLSLLNAQVLRKIQEFKANIPEDKGLATAPGSDCDSVALVKHLLSSLPKHIYE